MNALEIVSNRIELRKQKWFGHLRRMRNRWKLQEKSRKGRPKRFQHEENLWAQEKRKNDDKNYFGASLAVRINLRTKLKKITFFQM